MELKQHLPIIATIALSMFYTANAINGLAVYYNPPYYRKLCIYCYSCCSYVVCSKIFYMTFTYNLGGIQIVAFTHICSFET